MLNQFRAIYKKMYLKRLINRGLVVGNNLNLEKGVNIDANFPWLIEIGNDVVLAPWVYILAHDAAPVRRIEFTKLGKVTIGDGTFIGARTIVLPGVNIGSNVIIGCGSIVSHDIPDNSVAAGNPARVIMSIEEYTCRQKSLMLQMPVYYRENTVWGGVTSKMKASMVLEMEPYAYVMTGKQGEIKKGNMGI